KARLFDAAEPNTALVVNVDDPYGIRLAAGRSNCVTIGFDAAAQLRATDVRGDRHGSSFVVGDRRFATNLPGPFNVLNALTAIERAVALAQPGDVVVLAGKGHERVQELADGVTVPFDDVAIAREALRARLAA